MFPPDAVPPVPPTPAFAEVVLNAFPFVPFSPEVTFKSKGRIDIPPF